MTYLYPFQEVVLWVTENQYCDVNAKDFAGFAPLHETCVMGHVAIAKILIDHGANVNVSSTNGIRYCILFIQFCVSLLSIKCYTCDGYRLAFLV